MVGSLYLLTTRHEEKMASGKIVPGSLEDQRLPLSYRGQMNAFKTGQNQEIVIPGCDLVIADRSTLVRTTMTLQHMLAGAGYNPDDAKQITWNREDNRIGLSAGANFQHAVLPGYKPTLPEADDYVRGTLTECWGLTHPEDPTRPVMADFAYALLDNTITAVTNLLPAVKQGAKALHVQATHAPIIDSLDAALYETVSVDHTGKATVTPFWPGHYAMGMFLTGRALADLDTDNPALEFTGKDQRQKIISLDKLKELRDLLVNHATGSF